jgi:hypothetical protein
VNKLNEELNYLVARKRRDGKNEDERYHNER